MLPVVAEDAAAAAIAPDPPPTPAVLPPRSASRSNLGPMRATWAGEGEKLRNSERLKPAPTGVLTAELPLIGAGGGEEKSSRPRCERRDLAGEGEVAR